MNYSGNKRYYGQASGRLLRQSVYHRFASPGPDLIQRSLASSHRCPTYRFKEQVFWLSMDSHLTLNGTITQREKWSGTCCMVHSDQIISILVCCDETWAGQSQGGTSFKHHNLIILLTKVYTIYCVIRIISPDPHQTIPSPKL